MEKFIKKPFYSVMVIIFLVITGSWSLWRMPADYFPGLNYPLINVVTEYSGVSPRSMEMLVTQPIEEALQSVRGVQRTSSVTAMGHSEVTVEFGSGYSVMEARQLTAAALSSLAGQLPAGVRPVIDNLGSRMQQVIGFTFVNPDIPPSRLRYLVQYRIKPALLGLKNISRIEVLGGEQPAVVVEPDLQKLRRLHLCFRDIAKVLKANNIVVSGRYLTQNYYDIPIRGNGQYQSLTDLQNIAVAAGPHGIPVFLKSVAQIKKGGLPQHYLIRSGKSPAVALMVQKSESAGTLEVARSVQKAMQSLQKLLPKGTRIYKFYDQSEILAASLSGIRKEIYLGALLAMMVIFLFLRRPVPTLIVSVTIPLSLLFAAIVMYAIGYTLNMITLAALTLSLGMVVDDAIIVLEIIEKSLEEGNPLWESVRSGVREIFAADLNGTLTTIIVFVPLLFVTGYLKDMVTPFGVTIGLTLFGSFLLSVTLVPALVYLNGGVKKAVTETPLFLRKFHRLNGKLLHYVLLYKKPVLLVLMVLFVAGAVLTPVFNRSEILPAVDEGALLFEYTMRPGVSLKESGKVAEELIRVIQKNPNVDNIFLRIGSPGGTYYTEGVNRGEMFIKLVDKKHRTESVAQLMEGFKKQLASFEGVVILYHQPTQENIDESFSGLPAFFGITLSGPDLDTLTRLMSVVEDTVKTSGDFSDIINNAKYLVPQLEVVPNRLAMARFGITAFDLFREMELAFRGEVVARFMKRQRPVSVFLRLTPEQRKNPDALKHLAVRTPNGTYVPLGRLAVLRTVYTLPSISHINGQRELTLMADPEGNLFRSVRRLKAALGSRFLPEGYSLQVRGQYQTFLRMLKSFSFVLLLAVFLVYVILYLQFDSYWQPFVILLKIPLDFIGVFVLLLVTRQPLNLSVGLGLLTLTGVSVNNAIILIDKVNRLRKEGHYVLQEALAEAVRQRTRPILMTGLTTMIALFPAALGWGSAIHQPFAVTVMGGMVTGILFSLNIIPMLYAAFAERFEKHCDI